MVNTDISIVPRVSLPDSIWQLFPIYISVTFYEVQSVIEAFMLTFAVTAGLTIYTLQSKRDFSSMGAGYVQIKS